VRRTAVRPLTLRGLSCEQLEQRRLLVAQIDAGQHFLAPNAADQRVPVLVSGDEPITGVNLRAQLGDGVGPGEEPTFAGLDLSNALWQSLPVVVLGGPVREAPSLMQASVVLRNNGDTVSPPGVLGRMQIDTTGIFSGQFEFRLSHTGIGFDTDLLGDAAEIVNGSVAIAEAGDATLDGLFSSADLVLVFQAGEYEDDISQNSDWGDGDWNGDGEFSTADLVAAFQDGSYEAGSRPAAFKHHDLSSDKVAAALAALAIVDGTDLIRHRRP
jgi:hypothetical protein